MYNPFAELLSGEPISILALGSFFLMGIILLAVYAIGYKIYEKFKSGM